MNNLYRKNYCPERGFLTLDCVCMPSRKTRRGGEQKPRRISNKVPQFLSSTRPLGEFISSIQLSNLVWGMPNSVSKDFDLAMRTGLSKRFQRNLIAYMSVSILEFEIHHGFESGALSCCPFSDCWAEWWWLGCSIWVRVEPIILQLEKRVKCAFFQKSVFKLWNCLSSSISMIPSYSREPGLG